MKFSVIISIDQYLAKRGLKAIITENREYTLIETNNHLSKYWKQNIEIYQPNIFITDYQESNGSFDNSLDRLSEISKLTQVLIISDDEDPSRIKQVFDSGIMGFLTKHCSASEIENALANISNGTRFFCQEIIDILLNEQKSSDQLKSDGLSTREIEVLGLIGKGLTSKQIAENLFVSIHTVNSHRKSLLKKLDMKSPAQLIAYALERF